MKAKQKSIELHKRYGPINFPTDTEDIAEREGLTIITWSLLPPVEEVKVRQPLKI